MTTWGSVWLDPETDRYRQDKGQGTVTAVSGWQKLERKKNNDAFRSTACWRSNWQRRKS